MPFIEESRLLQNTANVYPSLTKEEVDMNERGKVSIYFCKFNQSLFSIFEQLSESDELQLDPFSHGNLAGFVSSHSGFFPDQPHSSHLSHLGLKDVQVSTAYKMIYRPYDYPGFCHTSSLLDGVEFTPIEQQNTGTNR